MKASDWIFKTGLLIIGVAFVVVYFFFSQNGRYQRTGSSVLDTRTGVIHTLYAEHIVYHHDYPNNRTTVNKEILEDTTK